MVKFNNGLMAKADLFQADWADAQIVHSGVAGPATAIISSRPERRVGARGYQAIFVPLAALSSPATGPMDGQPDVPLYIAAPEANVRI